MQYQGAVERFHSVMVTIQLLQQWLHAPAETERLEFKEAKQQFDSTKLLRYCAAIANEGGGYLIFGVTDQPPRRVVGTQAYSSATSLNSIKASIVNKLRLRVDVTEVKHPDGRVLVFEVPTRPTGQPIDFNGEYLMRAGEGLTGMTPDMLKRIFAEDQQDWFALAALSTASPDDVIALLDTQTYFELLNLPYPTSRDGVLRRLQSEGFIRKSSDSDWEITNLAAILLAKKLDAFSGSLARKAPRFVVYEGVNKLQTRNDIQGQRGYAVGFKGLINAVHTAAPKNRVIEDVVREEVKMFPRQALRELIANALVHQDFSITGSSLMIEMYDDRVEISNPGTPPIRVERFIDEYRSRNEQLADIMRRFGICEEKGSGIDKVINAAEAYQLPAPDFRVGETRTTAILFGHRNFTEMTKQDRIRACYQHCCLRYLSNRQMSNKSLRERFRLNTSKSGAVSNVIRHTKEGGLIRSDESDSASTRYARYLPFWA